MFANSENKGRLDSDFLWTVCSFYALISQEIFTINEIGIFHIITEWLLLFFAKFRSHRFKNEKVKTENLSQLNAPVLMTEPP